MVTVLAVGSRSADEGWIEQQQGIRGTEYVEKLIGREYAMST